MNLAEVDILSILIYGAIFLIPVATLVWFIVQLVLYIRTPREDSRKKTRRNLTIISAITAFVFCGGLIALIILFTMAIMFM